MLRTRWRLALGLALTCALAAVALAAAIPARYTATAQVLVGTLGRVAPGRADESLASSDPVAIQVDIVSSGRVALKVVDVLGVANDPAELARWREREGGRGSLRHAAADRLRERLTVVPNGTVSNGDAVLSIAFAGEDPASAARIANAFARAYGETLDEIRADAAQRQSEAAGRMRGLDGIGVVLLDPATEPMRADRPGLPVLALGAAMLGLFLGFGGALVAELRRPRIRSLADLQRVVGAVPAEQLSDASVSGRQQGAVRPAPSRVPRSSDDAGPETRPFARSVPTSVPIVAPAPDGAPAPDAALAPDAASAIPPIPIATRASPPSPPVRAREATVAAPAGGPVRRGDAGSWADARPARQPIGQLLVQAGLMHPPEVERTLAWARDEGIRFGEAAIARRLVTPAQLERMLAVQFGYPLLERGDSRVSDEVVAAFDAGLPAAADLRRLRARLDLKAFGPGTTRCLAVVAPGLDVGRSFVAANLAVSLAQAGRRVLLIDADLRRGRLHEVFGLPNRSGLSSMLNGRIDAGALQRIAELRELTVIACGPPAPNPSELLSREVFAHLLSSFRRAYDAVILDTGDLSGEPDALLVARQAGSALLVARCDGTPMAVLRDAAHLLHEEGVSLAAVVLDRH